MGQGQEELKARAAERAARLLLERWPQLQLGKPVALGLGTGSTAERFLERLAQLHKGGRLPGFVGGVPTSVRTERFARARGLPLTTLEAHPELALTVDGADELLPDTLDALKGGGGAHTREKVVAWASRDYWLIVDESKLVARLGASKPVPVEVVPFAVKLVERELVKLGAEPALRRLPNGRPFRTDNGLYVVDARFPGGLPDAARLAHELKTIPGVVEHGLFLGMARRAIVAGRDGVRVLERS